MVDAAGAAGGDHRHLDGLSHGPGEVEVVARLGAVTIHGGEQNLPGPEFHRLFRPGHGIEARRLPAALHMHLPAPLIPPAGVDRHHDALAAELFSPLADELRSSHGGRVETDLVGSGPQQLPDAVDGADAPAHGERNGDGLGGASHQIHQSGAPLVAGGDVEKDQLVGA